MSLRPCLDCGRPSSRPRCAFCTIEHDRTRRPSPRDRGYDAEYRRNRRLLLAADDVCWICGHPRANTADHVIPVSAGGTSELTNLRPAHLSCNAGRGARPGPRSTGEGPQPTGG